MKTYNIGLAIVAAAFALNATLADRAEAQNYYKWTDESGVTHYGSQPPPKFVDGAAKVRVNAAAPSGTEDAQSKIDARQQQLEEKATTPESTKSAATAQAEKEQAEANQKNCEIYKKNLTLMTQNHRIREKNQEGEVVLLSEEIKQERMTAAKDYIAEFCP